MSMVYKKFVPAVLCFLIIGVITLLALPKPHARAAGGSVAVWLTTADLRTHLAQQANLNFAAGNGTAPVSIAVNDGQTYQQMVGFGASITDSAAYLLKNTLSSTTYAQVMDNLFNPASGIGLDFLRQPMGATDLSLPSTTTFTYDDNNNQPDDASLSHFTIGRDSTYTIPILQRALQINPNLKIMANPWSPPAWMKTSGNVHSGSLNSNDYAALATYFVKFIQAYGAASLPVFAVTPQNEPLNGSCDFFCMSMSANEEANFIGNYLGPALARNGISTKILGYDGNWNDADYPLTLLNNSTANTYLAGTAWHCNIGSSDAQAHVHTSYQSKDTYETECLGGTSEGDNGFPDTMNVLINSIRNWSKTVVRWGMALNTNGSPHYNGCSTCRGVISIDGSDNVIYNGDYFGLGQASKFVAQGAYHIQCGDGGNGIEDVCFKNPNNSKVMVAYNSGANSQDFAVQWDNQAFSYTLPAGAAVTFTWDGIASAAGGTSPIAAPIFGPPNQDYNPNVTNLVYNQAIITSYGYNDNCCNASGTADISYPKNGGFPTLHNIATEGSGTYADPVTFAVPTTDVGGHFSGTFPVGTRVYIVELHKYFVLEDSCDDPGCQNDWFVKHIYHADLWMGPQYHVDNADALRTCEANITNEDNDTGTGILIANPSQDYPVDTTPMFANGVCSAKLYPNSLAGINLEGSSINGGNLDTSSIPAQAFVPYVYATGTQSYAAGGDLVALAKATGTSYFNLGFVDAKPGDKSGDTAQCSPSITASPTDATATAITNLRATKGDVAFAFGGPTGPELATACQDATSLTSAYAQVVNAYSLGYMDVDLGGPASDYNDTATNQRRVDALVALEQQTGVKVSLTIPITATGVPQWVQDMLSYGLDKQLKLRLINLLTMNFGAGNDTDTSIHDAFTNFSTFLQTKGYAHSLSYAATVMGITPLIGQQDDSTGTPAGTDFTIQDAADVLSLVQSNQIAQISLYFVERDHPCGAGMTPAGGQCNGQVGLRDYAYSLLLSQFNTTNSWADLIFISGALAGLGIGFFVVLGPIARRRAGAGGS